jgi:hypothetical protein
MLSEYVLYAFNEDVTVPIARLLILDADLLFFDKNPIEGKSKGEVFTEWILKEIKKKCPQILEPFIKDYNFFTNLLSVAVICGEKKVDLLPVIDLT